MPAQAPASLPTLHATVAAQAHRHSVPALDWLCAELAARSGWPAGVDAREAFSLALADGELAVRTAATPPPEGMVACGVCELGGGSDLLWTCRLDGAEDWFVRRGAALPAEFSSLLRTLDADVLDVPRRVDVPVVAGHLLGPAADGDPRTSLRVGATACGEATWLAWRTPTHVRVRGRSGGGLLLPALLLHLAGASGDTVAPRKWAMRAFAARDDARSEAARQLGRDVATASTETLRALLHAEDEVRLAAIDALVRRGAAGELPRIVAAAGPDAPWATLAAADALRSLWPTAPADVQQQTRAAVARSPSTPLRDAAAFTMRSRTAASDADPGERERLLAVLAVTAVALYGLWARERARARG